MRRLRLKEYLLGLTSSITESRHITAVKKPWRRSNRYEALGQMLITNQRLDKFTAARNNFIARGMLPPEHGPPPGFHDDEDDDGGPTDNDRVLADVRLARTPSMLMTAKLIFRTDQTSFQNVNILRMLMAWVSMFTNLCSLAFYADF